MNPSQHITRQHANTLLIVYLTSAIYSTTSITHCICNHSSDDTPVLLSPVQWVNSAMNFRSLCYATPVPLYLWPYVLTTTSIQLVSRAVCWPWPCRYLGGSLPLCPLAGNMVIFWKSFKALYFYRAAYFLPIFCVVSVSYHATWQCPFCIFFTSLLFMDGLASSR